MILFDLVRFWCFQRPFRHDDLSPAQQKTGVQSQPQQREQRSRLSFRHQKTYFYWLDRVCEERLYKNQLVLPEQNR